ncbi:hypothetical protein SKAU_G00263490 [Synaphobranchus kaupii]|uniref:Uncharacterized protein n=1 Tax=Synaphobranchus kaupii TaxID=118154 RepID=A0A9Q1INY2_SYNKA|nr:hypothetical protein SKAU_G00263490 [Synaphobranchus kaupii]
MIIIKPKRSQRVSSTREINYLTEARCSGGAMKVFCWSFLILNQWILRKSTRITVRSFNRLREKPIRGQAPGSLQPRNPDPGFNLCDQGFFATSSSSTPAGGRAEPTVQTYFRLCCRSTF